MMNVNYKILCLSGSIRKNSLNEKVLFTIRNQQPGLRYDFFDLSSLPYFNPDLEGEQTPPPVLAFLKAIEKTDAVLICTPEYVFSLPGLLKNALEWTVSSIVFSDKPLAFVIASSAGEKAFETLDLIMSTLGAKTSEETKLLIRSPKSKLNEQGEFDSQTLAQLHNLMKALNILVTEARKE